MSDLYYVTKIRGCIALKDIKKGTLIVSESPKLIAKGNPWSLDPTHKVEPVEAQSYVKSILSSFFKMSKTDQEEFLKLPNMYNDTRSFPDSITNLKYFESLIKRSDEDFDEKKLKVVAIFATNRLFYEVVSLDVESFAPRLTQPTEHQQGVIIRVSQFHHSCRPNVVTENYLENYEVRAITKIKAGQQITMSRYVGNDPVFCMNPFETRQWRLYQELYFICSCEFCQEQDEKIRKETDVQAMLREVTESELSKLIYQELETRQKFYQLSNRKDLPDFKDYYTENSQKAKDYIECAKNLYNYGKDKKVQPICLYRLLQRGYCISAMIFQLTEHKYQKMFFEKEAINFAKAAQKFEKVLGNELVRPEVWKRRQSNLIPGLSTMFDPAYSSQPQKMYGVSTNQVDWSIMK